MIQRDPYVAIADPTRRRIIDMLHGRGSLAAGDIAARFGRRSRPGISRHLRVLRDCGVVDVRRDGKAQLYTLRKGPLEQIRDVWLSKFGDMQRDSLKTLRMRVEGS
jgi:DNA-binding transcriptional ArsR family regulator